MEKFHNLEIFEVMKFPYFFLTLSHFFTKMQMDSNKTYNMKVVVHHKVYNFDTQSFLKRSLYLKLWFLEQGSLKLLT